jgi:hypothetical protein
MECLYVNLGTVSGSCLTTIAALGGGFLADNYSSRINDNVLRFSVNYGRREVLSFFSSPA